MLAFSRTLPNSHPVEDETDALRRALALLAIGALAAVVLGAPASGSAGSALVTNGSPTNPFPQNKQNEPAVAIDPTNPDVVVAGANDEIDLEACAVGNPTRCPFTAGVGVSGVYFSLDGGHTWTQPTYTGFSARGCTSGASCTPNTAGPIGTLPWYSENGLVSDGDPAIAFGPKPGASGFSWSNGSRLYYANLAANFSTLRKEQAFRGFEAIAVSRTDDVATAAPGGTGGKNAWKPPVIVSSRTSSTTFTDKEAIWADNAASSPFFGNVYVCWASFRGQELSPNAAPDPIMVSRSTDGGDSWSAPAQVSPAANNIVSIGRQDCAVRTDSKGRLYVFWQGGARPGENAHFLARSFDGGRSFERPRTVATFNPVGHFDPNTGRFSFDGIGGARTGTAPSVDIANGTPSGAGATDIVALAWADGTTPTAAGQPFEKALVRLSKDGGVSWTAPVSASPATDRPDFPAVAISPNGQNLYVVYDAFHAPWQKTTASARTMQGVVRHATVNISTLATGAFADLHRGASGDARGSSQNNQAAEFLGDYNYAAATDTFVVAVWNDVRSAADCSAEDAYRAALSTASPLPRPAPGTDCPVGFGNSDIFSFSNK